MHVNITKSKNFKFIYIIKDFYNNKSRVLLRYMKSLAKNMFNDQVIVWAKGYAKSLTLKKKNDNYVTIIPFSPDKIIEHDLQRKFNCRYLFLQNIYYNLRLDNIYCNIKNKYKFDFDIDAIQILFIPAFYVLQVNFLPMNIPQHC